MKAVICPKCQYQRKPTDDAVHQDLCPACGISYSKWRARQPSAESSPTATGAATGTPHFRVEPDTAASLRQQLISAFTYVPERVPSHAFWGRACLLPALMLWTVYFIQAGVDWEVVGSSFMHNINLPFHEFGHVFFAPFGRFMTIAGGSLFQLLLPLGLMLGFVFHQRETFGGSVALWWCGQSFVDLAPYIADARYRTLPLVGGRGEDSHDWGNLLTMLSAVDRAPAIATACFTAGALIMVSALLWAAYLLKQQYAVLQSVRQ